MQSGILNHNRSDTADNTLYVVSLPYPLVPLPVHLPPPPWLAARLDEPKSLSARRDGAPRRPANQRGAAPRDRRGAAPPSGAAPAAAADVSPVATLLK